MNIFTHNYSFHQGLDLGCGISIWRSCTVVDVCTLGTFCFGHELPESWALNPNVHMAHHLAWTSPPTQRNVGQPVHCPIPSSQNNRGIMGRWEEELVLAALFLKYPVNGAKKRARSVRKASKWFVHAAMEDELPFINILLILEGRL